MVELQQRAERRELGDELHACCARQYEEYERKSDARRNAQLQGRSTSLNLVGGALHNGGVIWEERGERGKPPGQQCRMNIVFCSFLDADVYYCIVVLCFVVSTCMECGLIVRVTTKLRMG